jgi:hypothetical protein
MEGRDSCPLAKAFDDPALLEKSAACSTSAITRAERHKTLQSATRKSVRASARSLASVQSSISTPS